MSTKPYLKIPVGNVFDWKGTHTVVRYDDEGNWIKIRNEDYKGFLVYVEDDHFESDDREIAAMLRREQPQPTREQPKPTREQSEEDALLDELGAGEQRELPFRSGDECLPEGANLEPEMARKLSNVVVMASQHPRDTRYRRAAKGAMRKFLACPIQNLKKVAGDIDPKVRVLIVHNMMSKSAPQSAANIADYMSPVYVGFIHNEDSAAEVFDRLPAEAQRIMQEREAKIEDRRADKIESEVAQEYLNLKFDESDIDGELLSELVKVGETMGYRD